MKKLLYIALVVLPLPGYSQSGQIAGPTASIDGIVNEMLHLITVQEGETPDTAAIRNLFLPAARLTVLNQKDSAFAESISLDQFISLLGDAYYERGFMEKEIHKVVDEYNGIAQVFQSYHVKDSKNHEEQGINSYQLVYQNNRWWIVSILWTGDSNGVGLPKKYRAR